ncbi:hypothetical protein D9M70_428880 [compost metagenome]
MLNEALAVEDVVGLLQRVDCHVGHSTDRIVAAQRYQQTSRVNFLTDIREDLIGFRIGRLVDRVELTPEFEDTLLKSCGSKLLQITTAYLHAVFSPCHIGRHQHVGLTTVHVVAVLVNCRGLCELGTLSNKSILTELLYHITIALIFSTEVLVGNVIVRQHHHTDLTGAVVLVDDCSLWGVTNAVHPRSAAKTRNHFKDLDVIVEFD